MVPKLLKLTVTVLAFLGVAAHASLLTRTECVCIASGLTGYRLRYILQRSPFAPDPAPTHLANIKPSHPAHTDSGVGIPESNLAFTAQSDCVSVLGPGACSLDLTYFKTYSNTTEGHTFKYNRVLFGPDRWEVDGDKRKVDVLAARNVADLQGYCERQCKEVDVGLEANCVAIKDCKVQWFEVPDPKLKSGNMVFVETEDGVDG